LPTLSVFLRELFQSVIWDLFPKMGIFAPYMRPPPAKKKTGVLRYQPGVNLGPGWYQRIRGKVKTGKRSGDEWTHISGPFPGLSVRRYEFGKVVYFKTQDPMFYQRPRLIFKSPTKGLREKENARGGKSRYDLYSLFLHICVRVIGLV
jgi:hypothetical protein